MANSRVPQACGTLQPEWAHTPYFQRCHGCMTRYPSQAG